MYSVYVLKKIYKALTDNRLIALIWGIVRTLVFVTKSKILYYEKVNEGTLNIPLWFRNLYTKKNKKYFFDSSSCFDPSLSLFGVPSDQNWLGLVYGYKLRPQTESTKICD